MKVYIASGQEIDRRLNLDKRRHPEGLCNNLADEEISEAFYDLQDTIRDGLEKVFWEHFDDGISRSSYQPWETGAMHTLFSFESDMIGSELMIIQVNTEIMGDKLIGLILSYLDKHQNYCVAVGAYNGALKGSQYLGRFVISLDKIIVEDSLCALWTKRVHFWEIEKSSS